MAITFRVEGLKECEEALEDLINRLGVSRASAINTVRRAQAYALEPIRSAMQSAVPVRSGRLKASIGISHKLSRHAKSQRGKVSPAEMFVGLSANVPTNLPHLIEFGSAHTKPQPFARPAIDANIRRTTARFASQLRIEIEKTAERARRKQARLLARMKK